MLIISLSSAAAGITVLIVVTLFLCLRRSKPTKTGGEEDDQTTNQEKRIQLHVYDELKPKMAVPEDISFIDAEEEENTTPTVPTVTDQPKTAKGFIGVKGFH